jgi:CheY-like chemotaxis protein
MPTETMQHSPSLREEGRSDAETVLVVDDYPVDRRRAGAIIAKVPGLAVAYAEGGAEALDAIDRDRPSVILTDLQMSGMDGLALVEEVRSRHPEIPVILMTAHGSEEIAIQALRAGATNYVPKRSLALDLPPTLRRILDVAAAGRKRARLLGSMKFHESRFELENAPELLVPLVQVLQEDLAAMGLCDATSLMRVAVAMQEVLANALFHGNLEVSSDLRQDDERLFYDEAERRRGLEPYRSRAIHVGARLDRSAATYVVRDEGPGFDTSALDRPIDPEAMMRIGGRGLLLIRTFMDEVEFNARGNQITMVKRAMMRRPAAAAP